ncbi:MAG: glycosyltransferase family 39 protein, partial [Holophagales bacterium]|nr:glycosyltransferase family 39 protein [Holophagales bacterium]
MSHEPTERLPGEAAAAKRHREILVGAGLAAFLVAQRSLFLGADPPTDFHYHFLTDEGGWAHNARLRELFGVWRLDDDAVPLHGAFLYTLALRGIYALFGVGLVQTRLLAVAGGLLTCALLYLFVRRQRSWPTAAVATLLFGASSFVSAHHRVAFVESFQLPFVA